MLERLVGKALNHFLSKYFEENETPKTSLLAGVWSGFLTLENLRLRCSVLNEQLAQVGLPVEIVHLSIRKLEMTIPWSQVLKRDTAVLVLDGVHVLARMRYGDKDNINVLLVQQRQVQKRRRSLEEATLNLNSGGAASSGNSWNEILQQRLQDGIFPAVIDCLQLHIRDCHIRLEDFCAEPFAVGLVLESIHVQHDHEAQKLNKDSIERKIHKKADLNRLGVYWSALEREGESILPTDRVEQRILSSLPAAEIIAALDETINRRSTEMSTIKSSRVPQHTYLLLPLDGYWNFIVSANPNRTGNQPVFRAICTVTDVVFQVRDFQCLQLLRLVHNFKEYKYSQRHARFRPRVTVNENPKAWWFYAVAAIRDEFAAKKRWSFGRFRRRFATRKLYCDLYERKLRSPDDAAGPGGPGSSLVLTEEESAHLSAMEDGYVDDLAVQDILLYRILVQKRIGVKPAAGKTSGTSSSWLRRKFQSMVGDEVDEDEYHRLLDYWRSLSTQSSGENNNSGTAEDSVFSVAISLELVVQQGQLSLFSPLGSTFDQPQLRRLQENFLNFTYSEFEGNFSLLRDYQSSAVNLRLRSFDVCEVRSNRMNYPIISRYKGKRSLDSNDSPSDEKKDPPLLVVQVTRNSSVLKDYDIGIQGRINALAVELVPDCEWIARLKVLIQPIPQLKQASKFWRELNMALINSWASRRLGIAAKAQTAVADHKAIHVDVEIDFPVVSVALGGDSRMSIDFGCADITTPNLSGVADSGLLERTRLQQKTDNLPQNVSTSDAETLSEHAESIHRNDNSWRTPRRSRRSGTDSSVDFGTGTKSSGGFGKTSTSFGLDVSGIDVDPFAENVVFLEKDRLSHQRNNDITQELFYDMYEMNVQMGQIMIETLGASAETMCAGVFVHVALHKSVIPSDHTLSRYKVLVFMDDIDFILSSFQINRLGASMAQWKSILSSPFSEPETCYSNIQLYGGVSQNSICTSSTDDRSYEGSVLSGDFDETEFFDAAEDGTVSDQASALIYDNWVADSESILSNDARSHSPSLHRRPRQSSISEVSSLSEGSVARKRLTFQENEHLTAENLARLEEEEDVDETIASRHDSFHSAGSSVRIVSVCRDLENDIANVIISISDKKATLAVLRRLECSEDTMHNLAHRKKEMKMLRIDLERLAVDLRALKAAQLEMSQLQLPKNSSLHEHDDIHKFDSKAVFSVRKASNLLQSIKKRHTDDALGLEHNMTRHLKRDIFQFSIVLSAITVKLVELDEANPKSNLNFHSFNNCTISASRLACAVRQRVGETRLIVNVDNVAVYTDTHVKEYILIAGVHEDVGKMFTGRYPEFEYSTSADDIFLKSSFVLQRRSSGHNCSNRVAKSMVCLGVIECFPKCDSLVSLLRTYSALRQSTKNDSVGLESREKEANKDRDDAALSYVDLTVRLSSIHIMLYEKEISAGTLILSDIGCRVIGVSADLLYKDRIRGDIRCGNFQVIQFSDESDRAFELFGKQDLYSPSFARFRFRVQRVPKNDNRGWVVEQLPQGIEEAHLSSLPQIQSSKKLSMESCAWNCHLGIRIDSNKVWIFPRAVRRLQNCLPALLKVKNLHSNTSEPEDAVPSPVGDPRILHIRWRCDLSIKKVCLRFDVSEADYGRDSLQCVDGSFGLNASAQVSSSVPRGIVLDFSLRDLCMLRPRDKWTIIEPTRVVTQVLIESDSVLGQLSCNPQFIVPDDFPWEQIPLLPDANEKKLCHPSSRIHLSNLCINLSAKALVAIADVATSFRIALTRTGTGRTGEHTIQSTLFSHVCQEFDFSMDKFSLTLYREKTKSDLSATQVGFAVLSIRDVKTLFLQSKMNIDFGFSMEGLMVDDISSSQGIRCITMNHWAELQGGSKKAFSMSAQLLKNLEACEASVSLNLGSTQIIALPSLVRSVFAFKIDVCKDIFKKTDARNSNSQKRSNRPARFSSFLFELSFFSLNARSETIELLLSSKDLSTCAADKSPVPVGVVALRFKPSFRGSIKFFDPNRLSTEACDGKVGDDGNDCIDQIFTPYLSARLNDVGTKTYAWTDTELSIEEFQCIRTHITKSKEEPFCFSASCDFTGEQRITNQFCFTMIQHGVFALKHSPCERKEVSRVSMANHVRIETDFVDVLVYISQSTAGMNEAMRVTIRPILDVIQKWRSNEKPEEPPIQDTNWLLETSSTVVWVAEGFKVTLVPGGATRLTESPIIKFEILRLAFGCAATPMKKFVRILSGTRLETVNAAARLSVHHLVTGGWLKCTLSASYHNRRLVAWEPFVEPWTLHVQLGLDLVNILNIPPIRNTVALQNSPGIPGSSLVNSFEAGGKRLLEIGRLLSSPFATSSIDEKKEAKKNVVSESNVDFCFLLLLRRAFDEVLEATYNGSTKISEVLSHLPGNSPLHWLQLFGFPSTIEFDSIETLPSFICCLSDSVPLNVNVTGALIENISEYMDGPQEKNSVKTAPHLIRNNSGLTVRFQEALDRNWLEAKDIAEKVLVENASEVALSLRRSVSQSCDPHQAYITLELEKSDGTTGQLAGPRKKKLDVHKSNLPVFSYKVASKIPVDTVGVHSYHLDWNLERKPDRHPVNLGWIIVRVELRAGIKVVSIESPLVFKNTSDISVFCEVRELERLSLKWRSLLVSNVEKDSVLPVPADLASRIHERSYFCGAFALSGNHVFTDKPENPSVDIAEAVRITPPSPYSSSSIGKGVIKEKHITLKIKPRYGADPHEEADGTSPPIHLDLCSLRIGSFSVEQTRQQHHAKSKKSVPEQRMLLFRSTLNFQNFLAGPIQLQVRLKRNEQIDDISPVTGLQTEAQNWIDLGLLATSADCRWAGAQPTEPIELRLRFVDQDGGILRQFPSWSAPVTIFGENSKVKNTSPTMSMSGRLEKVARLKMLDSSGVALFVSVVLEIGKGKQEGAGIQDNIRDFASTISTASRVVTFYCPFWIVDGTGLDLQYKSRSFIPGQVDASRDSFADDAIEYPIASSTLGLGELLDDNDLIYLPSRISFQVLMIGDEGSTTLQIRRRLTREETSNTTFSPWSDAIPLTTEYNTVFDVSVLPPPGLLASTHKILGASDVEEPFALRSRLIKAPKALGGAHGARLVHILCRYAVVNELGLEIEIIGSGSRCGPISVVADGRPRPFHFNDSSPLQFRPKEFGWLWSGKFLVRSRRREITLLLKHRIKGHSLLGTIEFQSSRSAGPCVIVFRRAAHAPYRIENNTMYPIQYHQRAFFMNRLLSKCAKSSFQDTVILAYHNTQFAWEEPDYGQRVVNLELSEFGDNIQNVSPGSLGSFRLDSLAPGTEVNLLDSRFVGVVVADGPTRVLRISERLSPDISVPVVKNDCKHGETLSMIVNIRLSHGIGLSIVDWHPQELVYIRLHGVALEQQTAGQKDSYTISIETMSIDNQLWITPYPVFLRMGGTTSKRRNKRQNALSLAWSRRRTPHNDFGNFTLIENVSFSTIPSNVSVDANLAAHAIEMAKRAKEIVSKNVNSGPKSRNMQLRKALNMELGNSCEDEAMNEGSPSSLIADDLYSAMDFVCTTAVAAKLRSKYKPPDATRSTRKECHMDEDAVFGLLMKPKHKIYVERLRISSTTAEISWSGALPMASSLPRVMRPALTFEGLPLLLRPYSSLHVFATVDEHIEALRAHFLSISRVIDIVIGILAKPSFLVRACIFTWRDSCATVFSSFAGGFLKTKEVIEASLDTLERQTINYPSLDIARRTMVHPIALVYCFLLKRLSNFTNDCSNILCYDSARHSARGGLVRLRNPRLFANVDGKDLLVEYVEGENAGKALLSRVGMGAHVGEGYVFHIENTRVPKAKSEDEIEKVPLILMLTLDRLVLLHGELDDRFCDVLWNASFSNIVDVEHHPTSHQNYTRVLFWYFHSSPCSLEDRYAKSVLSDSGGLESLQCKSVCVPSDTVKVLLGKMKLVNPAQSVF